MARFASCRWLDLATPVERLWWPSPRCFCRVLSVGCVCRAPCIEVERLRRVVGGFQLAELVPLPHLRRTALCSRTSKLHRWASHPCTYMKPNLVLQDPRCQIHRALRTDTGISHPTWQQ